MKPFEILVQQLSLEEGNRRHFAEKRLAVIFVYRAPQAVKVSFRYAANSYWTIESVLPDQLNLSLEKREDWLLDNIVKRRLPKVLRHIEGV